MPYPILLFSTIVLIAAIMVLAPMSSAQAYVGPGLGLGTVAVILGVIGSVFLAIGSVLWYPFKRLLKKGKNQTRKQGEGGER